MPIALAVLGTLLTQGVIVWYFWVINKEKAPVSVTPFGTAVVAGAALAGVATALDPGPLTATLLAMDVVMAGTILWLLTQRKMPDGALIANVGQPMPSLAATTDTGAPFDLTSMKQRRVLVKFFRGSW